MDTIRDSINCKNRPVLDVLSQIIFIIFQTCPLLWNSTRFSKVESGQLCAGGDGKDACDGDAGAPLINRDDVFELAGLVSFGFSYCGEIGKPGVYTKVFAYMDWIRENIAE